MSDTEVRLKSAASCSTLKPVQLRTQTQTRVLDLTPAWRHRPKIQSHRQDLVHLPSGFTHTPPVGLSITYTSPPASQRLWGQEWIVVFSSSRAEEPWWHVEWQASFLLVWTARFEAKHAFLFWQMSCAARRWKITCASMVVLELCWPILLCASFQYPREYNPSDSAVVLLAPSSSQPAARLTYKCQLFLQFSV